MAGIGLVLLMLLGLVGISSAMIIACTIVVFSKYSHKQATTFNFSWVPVDAGNYSPKKIGQYQYLDA